MPQWCCFCSASAYYLKVGITPILAAREETYPSPLHSILANSCCDSRVASNRALCLWWSDIHSPFWAPWSLSKSWCSFKALSLAHNFKRLLDKYIIFQIDVRTRKRTTVFSTVSYPEHLPRKRVQGSYSEGCWNLMWSSSRNFCCMVMAGILLIYLNGIFEQN